MSSVILPNNFSPKSIPGCQLWLDSQDTANMVLSGPRVTSWNDKSGNGNTATSLGSANPLLIQNLINGYQAISFPNTGTSPNPTYFFDGPISLTGASISYFVVCVPSSVSVMAGSPRILALAATGAVDYTSASYLVALYQYNTAFGAYRNGGGATPLAVTANTPYIFSAIATSGNVGIYQNGGTVTNITVSGTGNFSISRFRVANEMNPASDLFNGNIGEVIVYNSTITTDQRQQVEGYLAWKWGLQSSLDSGNPYKTRTFYPPEFPSNLNISSILGSVNTSSFLPNNFSPTQIPGCKLWFDANDSATIFSDTAGTTPITPGGLVARCNDKSGNNNYLQQATAGIRPVYQKTPGGYNGIYFSVNGIQLTTVNNSPVTGNASRTIFLIQQAGSITRVGTGPHTTTSPPNTFGIDNNTPITTLWCPYVYAGADNTIAVSIRTLAEIWVYYDASVSQIGGNYNFLTAQTKSTTLNTSASPWYFGLRPDGGGSVDSYICEFIMYDTFLTTAQRQQVEGYLAWKWGLQASLPSGNPYKNLPIYAYPAFPSSSIPSTILGNTNTASFRQSIFNPLTITGLQLWVDAADTSTYTPSSSISSWRNKGVAGGTVTTTSGTVGSKSFTQNNFPMMSFGTSAYMTAPSLTFSQTSRTAFAVVNIGAAGVGRTFLASTGGTSTVETTLNSYYPGSYTDIQISYYANVQYQTQTPSPFFNTTSIVSAVSAASTAAGGGIWVNGTSQSLTLTPSAPNYGTGTTTNQILGSAASFNMGEVLLFDGVISVVERQKVEGYLAWKWGLQGTLPASHPYKMFPPPP